MVRDPENFQKHFIEQKLDTMKMILDEVGIDFRYMITSCAGGSTFFGNFNVEIKPDEKERLM